MDGKEVVCTLCDARSAMGLKAGDCVPDDHKASWPHTLVHANGSRTSVVTCSICDARWQ